ncbi:MAG: hypothetical protein Q4D58_01940 [Synergistaceae bacterium]|nr:hypothetical protein [Synergistaceae bacterium]
MDAEMKTQDLAAARQMGEAVLAEAKKYLASAGNTDKPEQATVMERVAKLSRKLEGENAASIKDEARYVVDALNLLAEHVAARAVAKAEDFPTAVQEGEKVLAEAEKALKSNAGNPAVRAKLITRVAHLKEKLAGTDATSIKVESKFVLDALAMLK